MVAFSSGQPLCQVCNGTQAGLEKCIGSRSLGDARQLRYCIGIGGLCQLVDFIELLLDMPLTGVIL